MEKVSNYLVALERAFQSVALQKEEEFSRVSISPGKEEFFVSILIRHHRKSLETIDLVVNVKTGKVEREKEDEIT